MAHLKKNGCVSLLPGLGQDLRQRGEGLPSQEVLWVAAVIMLSSAFAEPLGALLGLVQLAVGGADEHSCSKRSLHSLVLVFTQSHP